MNTTQNKPLVSVVLPAYNAEKYLAEAIESIVNQTFKDFELIIINDCSKDQTLRIAQEYAKKDARILVLNNEENLRLSKTLNKGISYSKGKYIARMDADDVSTPERFKLQVDYLESHPDVGILGGSMLITDESGNVTGRRNYARDDKSLRKLIFNVSPFCHPAVMIRKEVLEKSGLYNPNSNPAEDLDIYFRIGKYSKFANLSDVLLRYRILPTSMTNSGIKNMELMSIKLRLKNATLNEYDATFFDYIYNFLHLMSVYILPYKIKMSLFKKIRDTDENDQGNS